MSDSTELCIYCRTPFDPSKGEGDHIIPAVLGEFRDDVRFRRACPTCNNRVGRSEQVFLQCGPEALYRKVAAPAKPRGRKRGRSLGHGAMGVPGPEFLMQSGDHHQLVAPLEGYPPTARPVDHLVILRKDGIEARFQLFRGMRPEQLRQRVAAAGIEDFTDARFHSGPSSFTEFAALVKTAWPNKQFCEGPSTEPGIHQAEGRVTFTFNDHYFRTLAKIAFHYYLAHNRRGFRGDEPAFESIRRFIMEGGDPSPHFDAPGARFVVPFGQLSDGRATTPAGWCHVLAAHEASRAVVGYVYLFAGPGCLREPHHIKLGDLQGRIELPSDVCGRVGVWGHAYHYYRQQPSVGYAGYVEPLAFT